MDENGFPSSPTVGTSRKVFSVARKLYRFGSRFVADTVYGVAVAVASLAVFKFWVIEVLLGGGIETEQTLFDGFVSFSRVSSHENVY